MALETSIPGWTCPHCSLTLDHWPKAEVVQFKWRRHKEVLAAAGELIQKGQQ
jgi:hypothetical protein